MSQSTDEEAAPEHKKVTTAEDVFNVVELAEKIMLELPIKDLLVNAQRVCKKWKSTIKGSPKLQQALFFAPLPGPQVVWLPCWDKAVWLEDDSDENVCEVMANPFYKQLKAFDAVPNDHDSEVLLRENASWRRMLVCQPPTNAVSDYPDKKPIENSEGVRFEDLKYGSSDFFLLLRVTHAGTNLWKSVEYANEVRRIVQPNPDLAK